MFAPKWRKESEYSGRNIPNLEQNLEGKNRQGFQNPKCKQLYSHCLCSVLASQVVIDVELLGFVYHWGLDVNSITAIGKFALVCWSWECRRDHLPHGQEVRPEI